MFFGFGYRARPLSVASGLSGVIPQPWVPSELFSLLEPGVWLDPGDFSTMFQDTAGTLPVTATGQRVARINDKSGNSNNAVQATVAAQPILRFDAITGTYYLDYDGIDDRLVLNINVSDSFDRITVVRQESWTLNDQFWGAGSSGLPELRQSIAFPGLIIASAGSPARVNDNLPVGEIGIVTEQLVGSPVFTSLQINNTTPVTSGSTTPFPAPTSMSLGARTAGTLAGNFRFYETVVHDTLTVDQLSDLKSYLATKHAINL